MNQLPMKPTELKWTITPKGVFRILFAFVWMQNTVMPLAVHLLSDVPVIGEFNTLLLPVITWILFLFATSYVNGRLRWKDLLFLSTVVIVILVTMLIYPKNAEYIQKDLLRILAMTLPMYVIGICYDHEQWEKDVYWYSIASVLLMFAWQMFQLSRGAQLEKDNMNASYNLLPSVLYLIYWAFSGRKIWQWVLPILGMYMLLSYGSRGSIMVVIVYLAVMLFVNVVLKRGGIWRVLGTVLLSSAVVVLLITDIMLDFAIFLQEKFAEIGVSTRILDFFIEDNIAYDNGREILNNVVTQGIRDNPILGSGFYGDRVLIGLQAGGYAHNWILELWCQFGIFIGTFIVLEVLIITFGAIKKIKLESERNLLIMLMCLIFTKLVLSYSYAIEPYFYFLLGFAVSGRRKKGEEE